MGTMQRLAKLGTNPFLGGVVSVLSLGRINLKRITHQAIISWVRQCRRHAASFALTLFHEHGIPIQSTKRMVRRLDKDIEQSQYEYYLNRWADQQLRYRV